MICFVLSDAIKSRTYLIGSNDKIENSTVILLDSDVISKKNRLTFTVFNQQDNLFDDEQYHVLTRVISLTIDKSELINDLKTLIKINFYLENNYEQNNVSLTCAYWHIFDNMTAQWLTDGCYLINITGQNIMCECNHLTHFAVLMV